MQNSDDILPAAFRRSLISTASTNVGDGILLVCWAWTASLLTRDAILIAAVPFTVRVGWLGFAVFAGVIADRFNRKRLIMAADISRFLLLAAFSGLVCLKVPFGPPAVFGVSSIPVYAALVISALLAGMLEVVRDNSMQTILPSLVRSGSLEKANGRNWAAELLCNSLVGPMLGGAMLLWAPYMPFAAAGLLYAFGAAAFLRVRGAFTLKKRQSTWWQDIREAGGFLHSHDFLLKLAAVAGAWNLFFMMALTALILHVQENLGGSSFDYGSVLAIGALGGAFGGWFGNRIVATLGPGRTARYALLFSTPSFLCMAVAPDTWSLALVYFLFNFSGLVWNTVSVSFRQRALPDRMRGRINSLYRLTAWALMPVGILGCGLIVRVTEETVGRSLAIALPFYVSAAGVFLVSVMTWPALGKGLDPRPGC